MMVLRRNRAENCDQGLTLVELVVAMSIFALVAVMGVQSLGVSLTLRDRLSDRADETDALGQGLALLRNDLSAALPLVFFPPAEAPPRSAIRELRGNQGFGVSIGGQPGLAQGAGGRDTAPEQRVIWRVDPETQALTRAAWATLYPVSATQQGPEVTVLDGVTGIALRYYRSGTGWSPGLGGRTLTRAAPAEAESGDADSAFETGREAYSSSLPLAVEITLTTRAFGDIQLIEYLQ